MYGKLIEGELQTAPKKLEINGNWVWNASAEDYLAQGWKAVRLTDEPEAPAGFYYESGWTETETEIVQTWTKKELPDEIDDAEAFRIIFEEESE